MTDNDLAEASRNLIADNRQRNHKKYPHRQSKSSRSPLEENENDLCSDLISYEETKSQVLKFHFREVGNLAQKSN